MKVSELVRLLYGDVKAGCVSLWDRQTKLSYHLPVTDPDQIALQAHALAHQQQHDVYYGVGLRRADLGPRFRGGKRDVSALPGVWLDVDVAGPGHAAQNLPTGLEGASAVLDLCPLEPTMVIDTGGGVHAYWLFDQLLELAPGQYEGVNSALRNFQRAITTGALARGWHVDMTANLDRVLRLPGTLNCKVQDNIRPIEALYWDGPRYSSREIFSLYQEVQAKAFTAIGLATPPTGNELLEDTIWKLRRLSNADNRRLINEVLAGRPFAAPGSRDSTLQSLASVVAFTAADGANPDTLAELFRPSLERMARDSDNPDNPCPTVEDAAEKIERAQRDAIKSRAAKKAQEDKIRAALSQKVSRPPEVDTKSDDVAHSTSGEDGASGGPGESKYNEQDVERFAKEQGTTPAGFKRRWIIQHGNSFYIFADGKYQYPVSKDAFPVRARDDLGKAGLQVYTFSQSGNQRLMTATELMDAYGTAARRAKGSLVEKNSWFDEDSGVFIERIAPLREITPAYDENIETWLRLLGGQHADKLLDWIATVTSLQVQSSALYLSGSGDAGKTMLAHGLSRLWTQAGPTELQDIVDSPFNGDIEKCPLVFGDESMTCTTTELRRLVGSSSHILRRKFMHNVELSGALRVILADNNGRMLVDTDEELGKNDIGAVSSKFLHISVNEDPVNFLRSIGGQSSGTKDWVRGDRIASFAAWLANTRKVNLGARFAVEGDSSMIAMHITTQGRAALVSEWIASFLSNPIPNIMQKKLVVMGNGRLFINVEAIYTHWGVYIQSHRTPPTQTSIGRALSNLSHKGEVRIGGRRYHDIRMGMIYTWMDANKVGDIAAIKQRIDTVVEIDLQTDN